MKMLDIIDICAISKKYKKNKNKRCFIISKFKIFIKDK